MSAAQPPGTGNPGAAVPVPLTIFAIPKPFRGHIEIIQRNAIESWTRLQPKPEIILLGDDPGTAEAAAELGILHIAEIQRNSQGTPLLNDLFAKAQASAASDVLCYVNSDIVLFDDFMQALSRVGSCSQRFLMIGRRTDLDITQPIPFQQENWAAEVRNLALRDGKLQIARSIDYFAFSEGLYPAMPPLAIGRYWWDNWLVWKARALGATVVDASSAVLAVHQNHDYSHTRYSRGKPEMMASEESVQNSRMVCEQNPSDFDQGLGWMYLYTIDDATHQLTATGMKRSHRHGWKMFKRISSRPRSLVKLAKRALTRPAPAASPDSSRSR
jgi:hypothetical protein